MSKVAINNKYHRELFSGDPCVHQQKSDVKKGSNLAGSSSRFLVQFAEYLLEARRCTGFYVLSDLLLIFTAL
jgi:hypothetical protein